MKKLKLDLQRFEEAEVLTREQLKMVMGGDGGSDGCSQEVWETCNAIGKIVNIVTCQCTDKPKIGCSSNGDCGPGEYCWINDIGWGTCMP